MFTPGFLKYYGKFLDFLYFTKATPYFWNTKTQRIETSHSKKFLGFKFIFLTHVMYSMFDAVALKRQLKNRDKDMYGFAITFIWCFAYLWVAVIAINLWTKKDDTVWLFDQLVKLDKKSQRVVHTKREPRLLQYILGLVAYGYVVAGLVWSVVLGASMHKEGFIYSLLPAKYKGGFFFVGFLTFEIWTKGHAISHIFWDQLFLLVTVLVPSFWISEETQNEENTTKQHLSKYRKFQVLSNYINATHLRIKLPLTLGIMFSFLLVGYYGCFRLFGKMSFLTYLVFPAVVNNCNIVPLLILVPASRLEKFSEVYLSKIRKIVPTCTKVDKAERKEMKALWNFGIKLGYLRAIEYSHIGIYFMAVGSYTVSMLVAFHK